MVKLNLVKGLPNSSNFCGGEICVGCHYEKAHRLPFDKSVSRCIAPLELIHIDLMGPISFSGCSYMLIFIDDFTRFTWVYFMNHKSEVLNKFMEFKGTVEGELC